MSFNFIRKKVLESSTELIFAQRELTTLFKGGQRNFLDKSIAILFRGYRIFFFDKSIAIENFNPFFNQNHYNQFSLNKY